MTCRDFQYEEGKEYETDKAELCKSGYHACLNPLDCFGYYNPAESVYHEVEIEDNGQRNSDDSKVVGKKIKIGARLSVADICKLHFEFVNERTTNNEQGKDYSSLSAQDRSSLSAQDCSSLSAQDRSSLSARNFSSLSARNYSSLSAQDRSSLSAQDCSSLSARNFSSLSAQDRSSLSAQDRSSLSARNYSSLSARNYSSLSAQDCSSLSAQDRSSLSAQDYSSLSAQDRSSLSAQDCSSLSARNYSSLSAQDCSSLSGGKDCVITAFNSKAKADIGSIITLANRECQGGRYIITAFKAFRIDGKRYKANTWYKLNEDGKVVKCDD